MAITKRTKVISKGERRSIANINRKTSAGDRFINQLNAFLKGKNVVMTVPNGNPLETNKKHIKVNAAQLYGDWRAMRSGYFVESISSKKSKKGKSK